MLLLLSIPHSGKVRATIVSRFCPLVVWVRPWLLIVECVSAVLYHIRTHLLLLIINIERWWYLLRSSNIGTWCTSDHRCLSFESFVWLLILAASRCTVHYGMIIQTEWAIREHLLLLLLISAFGSLKLPKAAIASLGVETWLDVWGRLQAFVEGLARGVLFVKHFNGAYLNSNFINTILP